MAKMTYEEFLVELDKMNPLENKKDWYRQSSIERYVVFSEIPVIEWRFYFDGDVIIKDTDHETEINVGNYEFEDILQKIKVWFGGI